MNREFARILVCLMDKELNLPSIVLEQIEEKLVKGKFDEVHKFYCDVKNTKNKYSL
jgi:hypothetical protein